MRHIAFISSLFVLFSILGGGVSRCAASDQERVVIRDGKKLLCSVRYSESVSGDCGVASYDAVFTGRILTVKQVGNGKRRDPANSGEPRASSDLRLTVVPTEIFKGNPTHEMRLTAEQGECFPDIHVGDEWLFFVEKNPDTREFEISYYLSNPSGPAEQRAEYLERLRRLARSDGVSYVAGEVELTFDDLPRANHKLVLRSEDGQRTYAIATDAHGRFELGPVSPGTFDIDANTDSQFRAIRENTAVASEANGCTFIKVELEINSEISGRVILPEGYQYKKSELGNFFPLFYVEVHTLDGKQAAGPFGTSIGDGLRFAVRGLRPGRYIVELVNYQGEKWLTVPVFAPGVTDDATALQIDLGWADHRTGLEIRVPPEALRAAQ
jgi:hypothetical protein